VWCLLTRCQIKKIKQFVIACHKNLKCWQRCGDGGACLSTTLLENETKKIPETVGRIALKLVQNRMPTPGLKSEANAKKCTSLQAI